MRPARLVETDDDTMLVFMYPDREELMEAIAAEHPHVFDVYEDGPRPHDYVDEEGAFWTVSVCPCCGDRYEECQGGGQGSHRTWGEVRVSERLLPTVG
jgi:hypothetical protein